MREFLRGWKRKGTRAGLSESDAIRHARAHAKVHDIAWYPPIGVHSETLRERCWWFFSRHREVWVVQTLVSTDKFTLGGGSAAFWIDKTTGQILRDAVYLE